LVGGGEVSLVVVLFCDGSDGLLVVVVNSY
jgi:hypothetical protein